MHKHGVILLTEYPNHFYVVILKHPLKGYKASKSTIRQMIKEAHKQGKAMQYIGNQIRIEL